MSVDEAIAALDRLIASVKAIRAERWLAEWPSKHPERPKPPPHVVEYLKQQDTYALRTGDSV